MACEEDTTPCKSRRCAQRGICNCSLVYSDGTTIPGSGRGNDPYIIERPPLIAIKDGNGNQIVPDANRCVQIPAYAVGVLSADTGQIIQPDVNGMITLPTASLNNLEFIDFYGNVIEVDNNDTIEFLADGAVTYTGIDTPVVDPLLNTITFPTMKAWEQKNIAPWTPNAGAIHQVTHGPRQFDVTKNVVLDIAINISENAYQSPSTTVVERNMNFAIEANLNGGVFTVIRALQWTRHAGHSHHSYHAQHLMQIPAGTNAAIVTRMRAVNSSVTMGPFAADLNVIMTWV